MSINLNLGSPNLMNPLIVMSVGGATVNATTDLSSFTSTQIAALSNTQVGALTSTQVRAISTGALEGLSNSQVQIGRAHV